MIRIAISTEAFKAIDWTLPLAASAIPEAPTEGAFPADLIGLGNLGSAQQLKLIR